MLDLMLESVLHDLIPVPAIEDHGIGAEGEVPGRCHDAVAPVAEAVAIALHGHRWTGHQIVGPLEVGMREKCTFSMAIRGVSVGKSNVMSQPT